MDLKENLTNELIGKKFNSQFELVNYAIKLAENMIYTGRDPRIKTESQNRALQVLTEILNNKDFLDEILEEGVTLESPIKVINHQDLAFDEPPAKSTESKKSRKLAAK